MKLVILFLLILFLPNVSSLIISEVEVNPPGTDARHEWVELYSEEEINLNGYKIVNNDGDQILLDGNFSGYYLYIFERQWLDNSDERVFLYTDSGLVDETDLFEDSENNDKTWQLCGEDWIFIESTQGEENDCETQEEPEEETPDEDEPQEEIPEENSNEEPEEEVKDNEEVVLISGDYSEEKDTERKPIEAKNIKSEDNTEIQDKTNYAKYGLVFFCILLIALFLIKRKNQKTEFEG